MKYQISNKKILLLYIFIPIELITFFSNFFSLYLHKYESIHILSTVFLITGHLLLLILLQDKLLCKWLLLYWIISFCLRIYNFLFFRFRLASIFLRFYNIIAYYFPGSLYWPGKIVFQQLLLTTVVSLLFIAAYLIKYFRLRNHTPLKLD